eukprot:TRINITY_DN7145_c0_g1_i1.p1 TRINITY_DN7145_c0_g1~~TRINITY_DN7145_c0_g1_i1.p1  ORF type:complete len:352 (-),score=40.65 TRINITY_DN7145_c0_g1_i1:16-1071(-)
MEVDANRPTKTKASSRGARKGWQPPTPTPTVVPRYEVGDPAGYRYLEENGYVVFANVATEAQQSHGIDLAWKFLEALPFGIDREDAKTWDTPSWPDPYRKGIVSGQGIGQSEFLWFCRGLSSVQTIYRTIWGEDELITSFDGMCFHRPIELQRSWITASPSWYHLDQNGIHKPTRICVQGFLNFFESGLTDGGLVVVPKSHTVFNAIFEARPKLASRGDFVNVAGDRTIWEGELKSANLKPIKVCAHAGDFVLWDSRTIHCNAPATTERPLPKSNKLLPPRRLVAYVCMTPKSRLTWAVTNRRINAYKQGHTTSHWPEDVSSSSSRQYKLQQAFVPPQLSAAQMALIPLDQ